MNQTMVEVQGTLRPDGTLALDEKPNLPAGRVRVTLQAAGATEDVMEILRQIRAEQAASGYVPRTAEEIDAELRLTRQEDEERMRRIEQLHEECQRQKRREGPSGP